MTRPTASLPRSHRGVTTVVRGEDKAQPALMRLPDVLRVTGLGTTKVYELVSQDLFPRPVVLARTRSGRARTVAWPAHEVYAWISARIAERDAQPGGCNESSKDAVRKRSVRRDRTSSSRM